MKNFTDQQINDALKSAPKLIQEEIADGEATAELISSLGTKFKLHIDKIGMIAELNRNMLLGLVGPEEFLKELSVAGISNADAKQIMAEINQKIFVPLRDKMKNQTTPTPTPSSSPQTAQSVSQQSTKEPEKPVVPQPIVPKSPPLQSQPQQNRPAMTELPKPIPPPATLPSPANDKNFLEDHEEPSIVLDRADDLASLGINKIPFPQKKIVPRPAVAFGVGGPSPTNLPGAIIPSSPKPVPPVPAKPYSVDPYREPIE